MTSGQALREQMDKGFVVLPGVYSAISAKAATAAGAQALYLSGAGVTNSLLAVPDIALINLSEMAQQAAYVTQAAGGTPVIADADTGYGDVHNVARTVLEMERAGLAGIHLEDQLSPKRCGHLEGKALIRPQEMASKIAAAVDSKKDKSFLVIARTDARQPESLDQAIQRAKLYVDHGADAIFPEGLESESEFEQFRRNIRAPLLANMTEFGKTPIITADRFKELGYNLVIFPMTAFRVMLKSITEAYEELLKTGTQKGLLEKMKTREELYELIEYARYTELDAKWADEARRGTK
jgi:methylisocitrate lyase